MMNANDLAMVSTALDELMICKGRPLLQPEHKIVWLKYLAGCRVDALCWAIDSLIRTPGPWPEMASVLEMAAAHRGAFPKVYELEAEERFKATLLAPPKKELTHAEN